jgi:hypothetical protein
MSVHHSPTLIPPSPQLIPPARLFCALIANKYDSIRRLCRKGCRLFFAHLALIQIVPNNLSRAFKDNPDGCALILPTSLDISAYYFIH